MKKSLFTVYIEQDEDGVFIGSIPSMPSCHAQGKTQTEMLKNLQEVLKLCIRNINLDDLAKTQFVGVQNLKISHA